MTVTTNTQSASQIRNQAVGQLVTDAGAAAALTVACGFVPRVVRLHNLTDRISDEWFEGMAVLSSLHTVAAGTRTLELANGISITANGFTVNATTMLASKVFTWEAIG